MKKTIKKLKITPKKHIVLLTHVLLNTMFVSFLLFFLNSWIKLNPIYVTILFSLIILPTLYLHIKYYIHDKGKKVILTKDSIYVITKDQNKIDIEEINKIVIIGSPSLINKTYPILISPNYYCIKLYFDEINMITISSLFDIQLKEYIKERGYSDKIEYETYKLY